MLRHKIIPIIFMLLFCMQLVACDTTVSLPKEPVMLSRETIQSTAVVKEYNESHWYAANAHNYKFSVYVYCEEYNISKTLTDQTRGMWITSDLKGLKKGDVIKINIIKTTYETHTSYEIKDMIK